MATYGSLFAGVGGFDMGFDRAGYECRFQWDRHCQSVLARHWPDTPRWADVSDVNGAQLPPADVIIFGSPCQDLSVAGHRAGLAGARSGLFHQAMRIIKEMRDATGHTQPRAVIWGNVVGALSSNGGADFGTVLDEMAEAGSLVIEWAVLDAQHFGVPQRRRRVFVVAILDPAAVAHCPDPLLPVSESVRRNPAPSDTSRQDATGTATPSTDSDGQWAAGSTDTGILRQSISSKWSKGSSGPSGDEYINMVVAYSIREDANAGTFSATPLDRANSLSALRPSVQSHHAQAFIVEPLSFDTQFGCNANVFADQSPTLESTQQSPPVLQPNELFYESGPRFIKQTDNAGCLRSEGENRESQPSHTVVAYDEYNDALGGEIHHALRAGTKQSTGVLTNMAVRRLTPVECERLMGWPDDHTRWTVDGKEQADTHRYRQRGNGVATPVAQWIAGHLLPLLQPTLVDCTDGKQEQEQR